MSHRRKILRRLAILDAALALTALLPLLWQIPYLARAWRLSPIDREHIQVWGLATVVCAGFAAMALVRSVRRPGGIRRRRRRNPLANMLANIAAFGCTAAFAIGVLKSVNALRLTGAIGLAWSTVWLVYGGRAASRFLPAVLCALLTVPGVIFWAARAGQTVVDASAPAFAPEFAPHSAEGFIGREVPLGGSVSRLFRTGKARRFVFADKTATVSVLLATVGSDIHEIHPAAHCLRTTRWHVESETLLPLDLPKGGAASAAQTPLFVTEAVASRPLERVLVWIWYSSDAASTGSFLQFRHDYTPSANWRMYWLMTNIPPAPDGPARARENLTRFLTALRQP